MAKRHFLQQAHKFTKKHDVAGQFLSEKLDGHRCFWDGGITKGISCYDIPWANSASHKHVRYATGLWSRYGHPIHAPSWFTDALPPFPLDGELWKGRSKFQKVSSTCKKHIPIDSEWHGVTFMVFDSPTLETILYDSVIDIPNYRVDISGSLDFCRGLTTRLRHHDCCHFCDTYEWMRANVTQNKHLQILKQHPVSSNFVEAIQQVDTHLSRILQLGGEGLVLRNPVGIYVPERVHSVTKNKPYHDAEGEVVGYTTGRETDRGSKLLGMMGTVIVRWNDKLFKVSGFTNAERRLISGYSLDSPDAISWAEMNPETECPTWIRAAHFPRGSQITFKYRELTDAGIPKEASYLRKFEVV